MQTDADCAAGAAGQTALPHHLATDLTDGGTLARIQLDNQYYLLRITRAGKLILTK